MADTVGLTQLPFEVNRRQQLLVIRTGRAVDSAVLDIADARIGGLVAQTPLPAQIARIARELDVRVEALFLDHAGDDAVGLVHDQISFVLRLPLQRRVSDLALLLTSVHADLHAN